MKLDVQRASADGASIFFCPFWDDTEFDYLIFFRKETTNKKTRSSSSECYFSFCRTCKNAKAASSAASAEAERGWKRHGEEEGL